MNKKVFVSMVVLVVCFLFGMYIAKIFFPEQFVFAIENQTAIKVGNYIDNHKWLYYICCGITAYITYFLYCCACSERKYLNWKENLIILACIIVIRLISLFDNTLATSIQLSSFIFFPYITKGKLKNSAIVYTVHCISQALSLSIRNLPIYLTNTNFITSLLLTIEMYLWLILFYIIFNYKGEKEKNGTNGTASLREQKIEILSEQNCKNEETD